MVASAQTAAPPVPCHFVGCHIEVNTVDADGAWIRRPGTKLCSKCRGASPAIAYCSEQCQKSDWTFHREYCGKQAYTFDILLVGSSNPAISRTVAVPSWWTFKQFHYVMQYSMGPWQNTHLHEFRFVDTPSDPRNFFSARRDLLKIVTQDALDEPDMSGMPGFGVMPKLTQILEDKVKLCDIWEAGGKHRATVLIDGKVSLLEYEYDFGDCWTHLVTFKGAQQAQAARPIFSHAEGCGPVEDAGGISGWNSVKKAFETTTQSKGQLEKRKWARDVSGQGEAYNPFKVLETKVMNYGGRWENHEQGYSEMEAEHEHY